MNWLIRIGLRQGWRRGLVGGSGVWAVVGGVALLGRLASRALKSEQEVVFLEQLEPGQVFRIRHEAPD